MSGYLVVRNWDRYQHYKNRKPPWIKFYVDLLDDYELAALPIPTRLFYDLFLLLAGRHDNLVPNDVRWLSEATHLEETNVSRSIEELSINGFIRSITRKPPASTLSASSTLALSRADARSQEGETEEEEGSPTGRTSSSDRSDTSPPETATQQKAATPPATSTKSKNGAANLPQNGAVADAALIPYRLAFKWLNDADNYRRTDWRNFIETEYGVTDDNDLTALEQEQARLLKDNP